MALRDMLNNSPKAVAAIVGVLVVAVIAYAIYVFSGGSAPGPTAAQAFYSTDDGTTFFRADEQEAPFQHEGVEAVRAYVFECDGEQFVGYLQRTSAEAREAKEQLKAAQSASAGGPPPNLGELQAAIAVGVEVKKPGNDKWVPLNSPQSADIVKVACPNGSGRPVPVNPNG